MLFSVSIHDALYYNQRSFCSHILLHVQSPSKIVYALIWFRLISNKKKVMYVRKRGYYLEIVFPIDFLKSFLTQEKRISRESWYNGSR